MKHESNIYEEVRDKHLVQVQVQVLAQLDQIIKEKSVVHQVISAKNKRKGMMNPLESKERKSKNTIRKREFPHLPHLHQSHINDHDNHDNDRNLNHLPRVDQDKEEKVNFRREGHEREVN